MVSGSVTMAGLFSIITVTCIWAAYIYVHYCYTKFAKIPYSDKEISDGDSVTIAGKSSMSKMCLIIVSTCTAYTFRVTSIVRK